MKQQEKGYKPIPDFMGYPFQENGQNGCNRMKQRQNKEMFLRRDQFFFDIKSQLSMISRARRREDGTEDELLSNAANTYEAEFNRWISKYIGRAKGFMSAFVVDKNNSTSMNSIKDGEEAEVHLSFPDWYDPTNYQQLSDAVHEYVVNATLFDFFSIVLPNDPLLTTKKDAMEEEKANIKLYVNDAKPGMLHKKLSPF
jgi:hypothetical protein